MRPAARLGVFIVFVALTREDGVPGARVVRMRGAHHIFLSNEGETLRETRAFLAGLK
jgi:hypothetical protein